MIKLFVFKKNAIKTALHLLFLKDKSNLQKIIL